MYNSRKMLALLLVLVMVFSVACSGGKTPAPSSDATSDSATGETTGESSGKTAGDAETLVVGVIAKMNGDFINGFTNSSYDVAIKTLIGTYAGYYETYPTDEQGAFVLDKTVNAKEPEIKENEDGSKTYRFFLNDKLVWNDGTPITAKDYILASLYYNTKAYLKTGYNSTPGDGLVGYQDYRDGKAKSFPGVKYIDDHTFEATIAKEQLPYFYEEYLVDAQPIPMHRLTPNLDIGEDGSSLVVKEGYQVSDADKAEFKELTEAKIADLEAELKTTLEEMEAGKADYGDDYEAEVAKTKQEAESKINEYKEGLNNLDAFDPLEVLLQTYALENTTNYRFKPDVTCGPYNFVSFENQTATLTLNDKFLGDFRGNKPVIKNIVQRYVNDEIDADLVLSGDLDLITGVIQGDKIEKAKSNPDKVGTVSYKRNGFGMIRFLTDLGPTKYKEVRQAIGYLMDRNIFVQNILGGYGTIVNGYFGLAQWVYQERADVIEEKLNSYTLNVEKANELLNASPYKFEKDGTTPWDKEKAVKEAEKGDAFDYWRYNDKGEKLMINHAAGAKEISEIISAELTNNGRLAGLAYNVVNIDFNTLLNALYTPDLNNPTYTAFSLATGFTPIIDPYYEFHSSQIGAQNLDRVNDPAADEIVLKMRNVDPKNKDEFADRWVDFQVWFNDYLPEIPIYANEYYDIYGMRVKGLHTTPFWGWEKDIVNLSLSK